MSDFTVEDILAARPRTLRERAADAYAESLAARDAQHAQTQDDLIADVYEFLPGTLGVSMDVVDRIEFTRSKYAPESPQIEWKLEDLRWRARYGREKVMTTGGRQFNDKEEIYEAFLLVEVYVKNSWKRVQVLVDLGKLLSP